MEGSFYPCRFLPLQPHRLCDTGGGPGVLLSGVMESKRYERGGRSNCDSPPLPPSPPRYNSYTRISDTSPQKSVRNSRRSPSYSEHRSCRSSYRESSVEKRRKRRKRSRSSERSRKYSRRRRSRSDSRCRSRSRERRRSYTPNRSTSRSISRSRTNSYSRSRSRSKSRSGRNRSRERRRDRNRHHRTSSHESDTLSEVVDHHRIISTVPPPPVQSNAFKNDGSFMEMFKKMQESMQAKDTPATSVLAEKPVAPPPLMVGKRRGGRILKTGIVAKPKIGQIAEQPKDAWSLYMAEVKKYREVCCQEEDNTRPLVK